MTDTHTHGLTGKLVTLRGDTDRDGFHNLYVVTRDADPDSPLVTVMHTRNGNTGTVRRGRCIPVIGAVSVMHGTPGTEQSEDAVHSPSRTLSRSALLRVATALDNIRKGSGE